MISKEDIVRKLKEVIDPEIGFDIVSLGEISEIKIEDKKVFIKIVPTTPLCPYLPLLIELTENKIKELNLEPVIEIDYETQWSLDRIDPEIRKKLEL